MKEKIARVLDRILKRKLYMVWDTHYDPIKRDLGTYVDTWSGIYGSKEAAERELRDRGYVKGKFMVMSHSGWDVKSYWKVLWRKKDSCGGYFYAAITEEHLKW